MLSFLSEFFSHCPLCPLASSCLFPIKVFSDNQVYRKFPVKVASRASVATLAIFAPQKHLLGLHPKPAGSLWTPCPEASVCGPVATAPGLYSPARQTGRGGDRRWP